MIPGPALARKRMQALNCQGVQAPGPGSQCRRGKQTGIGAGSKRGNARRRLALSPHSTRPACWPDPARVWQGWCRDVPRRASVTVTCDAPRLSGAWFPRARKGDRTARRCQETPRATGFQGCSRSTVRQVFCGTQWVCPKSWPHADGSLNSHSTVQGRPVLSTASIFCRCPGLPHMASLPPPSMRHTNLNCPDGPTFSPPSSKAMSVNVPVVMIDIPRSLRRRNCRLGGFHFDPIDCVIR